MDLKDAGMSFFDNICRKFESVCQDVDEVVSHDSIKYIERKVQDVGENVMKFYAKLAQVIVTPIMDPEMDEDEEINEQEDGDATISYFKSAKDVDVDYTTDTQSEVAFELPVKNQLDHESDDYEESAFGTSASESFSSTSSTLYASSSASMPIPSNVASSAISSNETIAEMRSNMLPNEAFTIYSNALKSSRSALALHNNAIGIIKWYSAYLYSQIDSYENGSSSIASSMESSIASLMESSGSSSDNYSCETTDLDKEAKNLSHQVELEESCVIVDYSTPHDDVPCEAQKQPSYKEKILDALYSKKRLAREYKELAILHRDNATKCFQGTSLPAPPTVLLRDSQTVHSSDSEWELL